jgi:excisionase family DNA binding protein
MVTLSAEDYLTVVQAADLLQVNPSTIRRWIREGMLPAYRIGQRRVALKRSDVASLIAPVRTGEESGQAMAPEERPQFRRLTAEEQQRGLAAVEQLKRFHRELLEERGGKPFPESWRLLDEARDERSRQLA